MARRGTAVGDVTNILQSENITGREKIPAMMQGDTEPQVVTTEGLKSYMNKDAAEALSILDIDEICDF